MEMLSGDRDPATVAERAEALLTGSRVKLYPYVRGLWPPQTLYTLGGTS